jgi:hypothetical protein
MAIITSTAIGDFNTGATWVGGVAPTPNDSAVVNHALTSAALVNLGGGTMTGTGSLTFSADVVCPSIGINVVCNGGTVGTPLKLVGAVSVSTGTAITNNSGKYLDTSLCTGTSSSGSGISNVGTITGTCIGTSTGGNGIFNFGTITGTCIGTSTDSSGIFNVGTITGTCIGTSTDSSGISNNGTITGTCIGTSTDSIGIHNFVTITGTCIGTGVTPINNVGSIHYTGTSDSFPVVHTDTLEIWQNKNAVVPGVFDGTTYQTSGFWSTSTGTPVTVSATNVLNTITTPNAGTLTLPLATDVLFTAPAYGVGGNGSTPSLYSTSRNKLKYLPAIVAGLEDGLAIQAATGTVQSDAALALAAKTEYPNAAATAVQTRVPDATPGAVGGLPILATVDSVLTIPANVSKLGSKAVTVDVGGTTFPASVASPTNITSATGIDVTKVAGTAVTMVTEVDSNVTKWLGTAAATPAVPGVPKVELDTTSAATVAKLEDMIEVIP